jgi:hypothetical protein
MSAGLCWRSFGWWTWAAAADKATLAALQALLARNDTDIAVLREIGLSIQ